MGSKIDLRRQIPENSKNRCLPDFRPRVFEIKLSNFDPPSKRLCRVYRSLERALGPVPSPNKIK